jgi:ribonuclease HI
MSLDLFLKNAAGHIHIYTDGACSGNPGAGGYGVYMHDTQKNEFELSGGEKDTTNNRMEMLAAVKALECFSESSVFKLTLYTDSQYLKNGINTWIKSWKKNGWKTSDRKPVKNQDLWIRLDALQVKIAPQWEWVPGHSNIYGNERADALARNAVVALKMR